MVHARSPACGSTGDRIASGGYGREEVERAGAYRVYDDPADLLDHLDEVGVRKTNLLDKQGCRSIAGQLFGIDELPEATSALKERIDAQQRLIRSQYRGADRR